MGKDSSGGLLVVLWQSSGDQQKTARRPQEDNTEDYEQLKEEYLELHEDTKSQPKKNRKKLPKLKMNKNTKKLIRMVNRIIKITSTNDMNITNINLMQYAGALLITNKITPAKPTTISFVDDLGAFFTFQSMFITQIAWPIIRN